jgi:hypothetical protein
VVWIGKEGTAEEGQIGITCVEPGKCIWQQALHSSRDEMGPAANAPGSNIALAPAPPAAMGGPGLERRRYPRYKCSGKLILTKEGTGASMSLKLTDIGLGGCYGETFSPLPLETGIAFVIQADELEIRGRGQVRTTHSSFGNGIAFTEMAADDWHRLNQLISRVASPTQREAHVQTVQTVEADISPTLQALLQLLEKKGIVTRNELLSELSSLRGRKT